mgnify:CR=1 FL=1
MKGNDDDLDHIRKSSTVNSMYIGSTINKPNTDSVIQAVATILHSQLMEVSCIKHMTRPNEPKIDVIKSILLMRTSLED